MTDAHTNVAILVDLQGPKIRIGEVENNLIVLENGSEVIFTTKECVGNSKKLSINYQQFPADVAVDEKILIDDGKIVLRCYRNE